MRKLLIIISILTLVSKVSVAGNKDRSGQAGAYELLINPWARSSGWNGLNTANCTGLESLNQNPGGLAFTTGTEVIFAHDIYLQGADININAFGFSQSLGKDGGVLAADVMAMGFGDIQMTTTQNPEGGIGTYRPLFLNVAVAYAKTFSHSIHCGFVVRGINEGVTNVNAFGLSLDAGVQYVTSLGPQNAAHKDNVHFGISLRNIGTPMKFTGDALTFQGTAPQGNYPLAEEMGSQQFELPSLLNIGGAYDFRFGVKQRLTIVANFTSNSFYEDQTGAGVEYSFLEEFMVRAGYNYEAGDLSSGYVNRATAFTGLSAGFTLEVPLKKGGPSFAIDYSFRQSNPWGGTHTIGVRLLL